MNRRGIATLVCIMLMGTTAAVLTGVMGRAHLETHRTRMALEEAQASQLLRAGLAIAAEQAHSGKTVTGPIATPVGTIHVEWITPAAGNRACKIDVALPHVRRSVLCQVTGGGELRLK